MKKIIAISVMFALIAGAVFADTSIGGAVETRFSLARQTGGDGDDPTMGGSIGAAQFVFSGSNAEGTLGGMFRYKQTNEGKGNGGEALYDRVFVWWKPVEQVKIFLGIDQDGLFDTGDFMCWGYHAGDNDYLFNHHWDFWRQAFPGNWDGFGLAFSFYPIPGLDINLALPTGSVGWRQAPEASVFLGRPISNPDSDTPTGMLPGRLRFVANYSLDFGKISLVYIGGGAAKEKNTVYNGKNDGNDPNAIGANIGIIDAKNNGIFGLSALITAIEGIQIKVGGAILLNDESDNIINAGLGVVYNGEGFGVKFRAGLQMQKDMNGPIVTTKVGDGDMLITGSIMPFFAVGDNGQVLVDIGVTSWGGEMGWFVTPAYRLGIEGGAFKIGLQVWNNIQMGGNILISGSDFVRWNIPMLLAFNF